VGTGFFDTFGEPEAAEAEAQRGTATPAAAN